MSGISYIVGLCRRKYRHFVRPKYVSLMGVCLHLDENISRDVSNYIYNENYEVQEAHALIGLLKKGDRVLEVGAGIGFLGILMSKVLGGDNVLSYEANPKLIKVIQNNSMLNECSFEVKNCILSDKAGNTEFHLEKDFWSSSTHRRTNNVETINVQTEKVSEVLLKHRPNVLVMDIEGGEVDLLPKIDLTNFNKIVIEIHPHVIGNEASSNILLLILNGGFILNFKLSTGTTWAFER
jgi:FkbM family methyltransferase